MFVNNSTAVVGDTDFECCSNVTSLSDSCCHRCRYRTIPVMHAVIIVYYWTYIQGPVYSRWQVSSVCVRACACACVCAVFSIPTLMALYDQVSCPRSDCSLIRLNMVLHL